MTTQTTPSIHQLAEVQLSYNIAVKPDDRLRVMNAQDAYAVAKTIYDPNMIELREEFKVIFLNRGNMVLGYYNLSSGSTCGTTVDPKLVFVAALKCMASGIVLVHNHPSGRKAPSQADMELTKKLRNAGALLNIQILDHIILTVDSFYSFAEAGEL